jgi:DHA2 family multidrug resistance protein
VIITITAIFCALLEIVDTTIVNVALNDMRGNLGATLTEVGWVITAYAIGNVIIVPMTSWLSQQFGRRNYFAASIIIFTVFLFYAVMPQHLGARRFQVFPRFRWWCIVGNITNDYH